MVDLCLLLVLKYSPMNQLNAADCDDQLRTVTKNSELYLKERRIPPF